MSETSSARQVEQERRTWGVADALSAVRIPLAFAFVLVRSMPARAAILIVAAATDLLDGWVARRFGPSRLGAFVDPVADRLFMACAFGVVLFSGRLAWYEVLGVVLRDAAATVAFFVTAVRGQAAAIPARAGGKAVTVLQALTMFAFVFESALLRPLAWAAAAVGMYAIWDYTRAASRERIELGH